MKTYPKWLLLLAIPLCVPIAYYLRKSPSYTDVPTDMPDRMSIIARLRKLGIK